MLLSPISSIGQIIRDFGDLGERGFQVLENSAARK